MLYKDAVQECLEAEGINFTAVLERSRPLMEGSPCKVYCDANVQALDGYTCQRTPSLMDGPQKASQSNGATPGGELFGAVGLLSELVTIFRGS